MSTKHPHASPLKSHVGFWMRLVSNTVSHSFARKLEDSGVTVAEWVVLREMFEHGDRTNPANVALLTGLSRGAITKLIDRLLEKKLVTREASSRDRRYMDIALTREAKSLVPKLAALADQNDDEFFACLNKKERAGLIETLQKIAVAHQLQKAPIE
jgi:DNA-binding MarR family transcriptional regulator